MSVPTIIAIAVIFLLCATVGWFVGVKMYTKNSDKNKDLKCNGEKTDEKN
ncbi:MAG: LapA family protein [Oscillospiraceae bacterium]|nr:LapA family protein [Oscillospiraceae bacterium]MDD6086332.1 LapA family protein [Oscillospiraceae bacterium]MDY3257273.1 LapA family protein [Ruminococcus callidus]